MPVSMNGFSPSAFPALPKVPNTALGSAAGNAAPVNFQQMLMNSINQVGEQQIQARESVQSTLLGEGQTQVQAMMATKKAELAFRTMLQIRNKLIDAYNEIKDMRF